MITLHAGKLGCGKSYWATREVWRLINKGKNCYVNWKIDFTAYSLRKRKNPLYRFLNPYFKLGKVYYWSTLEDLYQLRNGEVFFDEAHMSVDARDFTKLPKEFKTKLTQSRKYGLNLHFISQHSQQVDITIRRLANEYVLHTKFWHLFRYKSWDGEAIEILANPLMPQPKSLSGGFFWFSKRLANCYDTFALFNPFAEYKQQPMWDIITALNLDQKKPDVHPVRPALGVLNKLKGGEINVLHNRSKGIDRERIRQAVHHDPSPRQSRRRFGPIPSAFLRSFEDQSRDAVEVSGQAGPS